MLNRPIRPRATTQPQLLLLIVNCSEAQLFWDLLVTKILKLNLPNIGKRDVVLFVNKVT